MIETLRIPIIKLYNNLIVSVQVGLSDPVVEQLKNDITQRIETTGATGLIIDVSGIDIMDSYISRAIRDIGLIAKLMGVQTIITGLKPMVAMTLVEMDMGLEGVQTKLNLEAALEALSAKREDEEAEGPVPVESPLDIK